MTREADADLVYSVAEAIEKLPELQRQIIYSCCQRLRFRVQKHTPANMKPIIKNNIATIKPGTAKCSIAIMQQHQLRIGGCVLSLLATRTISALSTLTVLRTATPLAIPVGSPRPSAFKLISESP